MLDYLHTVAIALSVILTCIAALAAIAWIIRPGERRIVSFPFRAKVWARNREKVIVDVLADFYTRRRDTQRNERHFDHFRRWWQGHAKAVTTRFAALHTCAYDMAGPDSWQALENELSDLPTYGCYEMARITVVGITPHVGFWEILKAIARGIRDALPGINEIMPALRQALIEALEMVKKLVMSGIEVYAAIQSVNHQIPIAISPVKQNPAAQKKLKTLEMKNETVVAVDEWLAKNKDAPKEVIKEAERMKQDIIFEGDQPDGDGK